ncbi:unnamed protein product [Larinioides sclopetarius]
MCIPGCDCNPGFLRNKLGKCVPRHKCQTSHAEQNLRCPPNELFVPCSAHCQQNCSNYNRRVVCPFVCVPGCVCDLGFVRGPDNKCIKKESCHTSEMKISIIVNTSCPLDEEMSECHAHCQRNCSNFEDLVLPCPRICVSGCVCKNGMIRGPDKKCILPQKCSLKRYSVAELFDADHGRCPPREHFDPCIAHCQKNCSNWMKPIPCSRMCVPGCICEDGFVRGPQGKCIYVKECFET